MNEGLIAARYAKALFFLTEKEKATKQVLEDMMNILAMYAQVPEFSALFTEPTIKSSKKKKILLEIFSKKFHLLTINLLDLLLKNHRENFLEAIARRYQTHYKDTRNEKTAVLSSVTPLPETTKKEMIRLIEQAFKCQVSLVEKQNEQVLGGFILRVENQQFDASLATRLKKIKNGLLNTIVEE